MIDLQQMFKPRPPRVLPTEEARRRYERVKMTNEMALAEEGIGPCTGDSYWCPTCGGLIIAEWSERTGSSWSLCPCGHLSGAPTHEAVNG